MIVASTLTELDAALDRMPRPRVVVMTMGALHEGHGSLFTIARSHGGTLVATIFVNPTQFGPSEDFDAYPRSLDADLKVCREHGVDVVFTPNVEVMYPNGPASTIHVDGIGGILEGASRPGHFDGMATIVTRLMDVTGCDAAVFGEKDFQQLAIVRRVVHDTGRSVTVIAAPTVREADGLAMSSRNRYLSQVGRSQAAAIPRALAAAQEQSTVEAMIAAARSELAKEPAIEIDYLEIRDPKFAPAPESGEARLLIAVRLEDVRLIDNVKVVLR